MERADRHALRHFACRDWSIEDNSAILTLMKKSDNTKEPVWTSNLGEDSEEAAFAAEVECICKISEDIALVFAYIYSEAV